MGHPLDFLLCPGPNPYLRRSPAGTRPRAASDAARVLALLERTRERLAEPFRQPALELTVVLHDSRQALALSNPLMPAVWGLSARPLRRYVAGWVGRRRAARALAARAARTRIRSLGLVRDACAGAGFALRAASDHRIQPRAPLGAGAVSRMAGAALGVAGRRCGHAGSPGRACTRAASWAGICAQAIALIFLLVHTMQR